MADGVLSRKTCSGGWARRPGLCALVLAAGALSAPLGAQVREVTADAEVFRKTPDGRRLAELVRGTRVMLTGTEGSWAAVDIEGWVSTAALASTSREGHNGIVSSAGGESLRAGPAGRVTGHLLNGFLLDRLEDRDGWTRVRRAGWVRSAALQPVAAGHAYASAQADRPPPLVVDGRELMTGDSALDMHVSPGGESVARVEPGTPITVVERGSGWTRVRLDGWVRSERLVTSDPDSVLADVSAAALKASPDDFAGMRVRWTVQFVALEAAEPERTDFYEGEPFLLARAPDAADGFVYIAVPPELMPAARSLRPLQSIDILAQVRTGRSALMGVPVLDLLALF